MDVVKVRNESEVFRLKDAFDEVLKFFGENSKTTPPSVFFPVFVRFVKAYRVSRTQMYTKSQQDTLHLSSSQEPFLSFIFFMQRQKYRSKYQKLFKQCSFYFFKQQKNTTEPHCRPPRNISRH